MTSRYRGVTFNKKSHKWQAVINSGGKHVHLGIFTCEEDAARAFDNAAIIVRGLKAKLNFGIAKYMAPDGSLIIDAVINAKLQGAYDPARKQRAKPTKRPAPVAPPSMGGGYPSSQLPGQATGPSFIGTGSGPPLHAQASAAAAAAVAAAANIGHNPSSAPAGMSPPMPAGAGAAAGREGEKVEEAAQDDTRSVGSARGTRDAGDAAEEASPITARQTSTTRQGQSDGSLVCRALGSLANSLAGSHILGSSLVPPFQNILQAQGQGKAREGQWLPSRIPPGSIGRPGGQTAGAFPQLQVGSQRLSHAGEGPVGSLPTSHGLGVVLQGGSLHSTRTDSLSPEIQLRNVMQARATTPQQDPVNPLKKDSPDSESSLWNLISQIESQLPPGCVLDCLVPDSSVNVLGLLYRDSALCGPGGTGPMTSAIWRDGSFVGRMTSAGREEARSCLESMMEFAVSFRRSENKKMKLSHPEDAKLETSSKTHVPTSGAGSQRLPAPHSVPHLLPVNPTSSNDYQAGYPAGGYVQLGSMTVADLAVMQQHPGQQTNPGSQTLDLSVGNGQHVHSYSHVGNNPQQDYHMEYPQGRQQQQSPGPGSLSFAPFPQHQLVQYVPHHMVHFSHTKHSGGSHHQYDQGDSPGHQGDYVLQLSGPSSAHQHIINGQNMVAVPVSKLGNHAVMYGGAVPYAPGAGDNDDGSDAANDESLPPGVENMELKKEANLNDSTKVAAVALQQLRSDTNPVRNTGNPPPYSPGDYNGNNVDSNGAHGGTGSQPSSIPGSNVNQSIHLSQHNQGQTHSQSVAHMMDTSNSGEGLTFPSSSKGSGSRDSGVMTSAGGTGGNDGELRRPRASREAVEALKALKAIDARLMVQQGELRLVPASSLVVGPGASMKGIPNLLPHRVRDLRDN